MSDDPRKHCNCDPELLSAYFDRQLDPDQLQAVEEHLRDCPHCAERLRHYQIIRDALPATEAQPPTDLAESVLGHLERDQLLAGFEQLATPTAPRGTRFFKAFAAAAVLAIVVSASILLVKSSSWHLPDPSDLALSSTPVSAQIKPSLSSPKPTAAIPPNAPRPARPPRTAVPDGIPAPATQPATTRPRQTPLTTFAKSRPTPILQQYRKLADTTIFLDAQDPPSWMFARDRLLAGFASLNLTALPPDAPTHKYTALTNGAFVPLPKSRLRDAPRYQAAYLVVLRPRTLPKLHQAITKLGLSLPGLDLTASPITSQPVTSRPFALTSAPTSTYATFPSTQSTRPALVALIIDLAVRSRTTTAPATSQPLTTRDIY